MAAWVRSTGVTEDVDEDLKTVVTGARDRVAQKMKDLRVADAIWRGIRRVPPLQQDRYR